jgi:hypothetical protein
VDLQISFTNGTSAKASQVLVTVQKSYDKANVQTLKVFDVEGSSTLGAGTYFITNTFITDGAGWVTLWATNIGAATLSNLTITGTSKR